jgi:hypothetical protein
MLDKILDKILDKWIDKVLDKIEDNILDKILYKKLDKVLEKLWDEILDMKLDKTIRHITTTTEPQPQPLPSLQTTTATITTTTSTTTTTNPTVKYHYYHQASTTCHNKNKYYNNDQHWTKTSTTDATKFAQTTTTNFAQTTTTRSAQTTTTCTYNIVKCISFVFAMIAKNRMHQHLSRTTIYDQIWWSYWWSYMMIIYDDHICWKYWWAFWRTFWKLTLFQNCLGIFGICFGIITGTSKIIQTLWRSFSFRKKRRICLKRRKIIVVSFPTIQITQKYHVQPICALFHFSILSYFQRHNRLSWRHNRLSWRHTRLSWRHNRAPSLKVRAIACRTFRFKLAIRTVYYASENGLLCIRKLFFSNFISRLCFKQI